MRKLVLVAALAALSCKPAGSSKLEGHWRGTRAEGAPVGSEDAANVFATSSEIIARGNQIAVSTPGSKQQGTYFVDAEDKNTVVIHTDKDGPDAKETFTFGEDGKTMIWKLGEGRAIHFQKLPN